MRLLVAILLWPTCLLAQAFTFNDPAWPTAPTAAAGLPNVTDGLMVWWKMDDGSGSLISDSSGNTVNATAYGGPTWATGQVGPYCLSLSGGAYGYTTDAGLNNWTAISVTMWVKISSDQPAYTRIFEKGATSELGLVVNQVGDNTVSVIGAGVAFTSVGVDVQSGSWIHLALTVASDLSTTLYINGAVNNSGTLPTPSNRTGGLSIAQYGGGSYTLTGSLDDMRIYNRALTSTEVTTIYGWRP